MRRGAAGLLLGIVVIVAGVQPVSAACFFTCRTTPTTKPPVTTPTTAAPKPAPAPAPAAFDPAAATQHLLDLTNGERAAAGLAPLTMRADVASIAQGQSAAMAAAGTIWHNEQYLTQSTRNALAAKMLGENVGMAGSIDQVHQALMNSPGHRANILEGAFSIVGMAAVKGPDGLVYITQDFVQPSGGTPRPVAVKRVAAAPAKPRVAAAPKPRVAAAPKVTTPTTAAPTTTAVPATTTTTVAIQPQSSVLAATQAGPMPVPATDPSGPGGTVMVVAFALLAAVSTGAVRVRRRRPQQKVEALEEQGLLG